MGRPPNLPEPWRSMAAKLGGVQALADALLCGVATLRRWAHGQTKPDRRAQELIDRLFRAHGLR